VLHRPHSAVAKTAGREDVENAGNEQNYQKAKILEGDHPRVLESTTVNNLDHHHAMPETRTGTKNKRKEKKSPPKKALFGVSFRNVLGIRKPQYGSIFKMLTMWDR
jgi:hypothetical protein